MEQSMQYLFPFDPQYIEATRQATLGISSWEDELKRFAWPQKSNTACSETAAGLILDGN
jgi:hypothetical protein